MLKKDLAVESTPENFKRRVFIGTDPEFVLAKGKKLVSAIPFIKGTKDNPQQLESGTALQYDNVALEFATTPVANSTDFINGLRRSFSEVMKELPKGIDIKAIPSAMFPPSELESEEAKKFGCMPDFNAWTKKQNKAPVPFHPSFRSFGAHIHVGALKPDGSLVDQEADFLLLEPGKLLTVKGMDLFHGVVATIQDNSPAAIERRRLYGKAGSFRPTEYGIEYRSLSNYWTKMPETAMLMSVMVDDVIESIVNGTLPKLIKAVKSSVIVNTINNGDVATAKTIFENYLKPNMSKSSIGLFEASSKKLERKVQPSIKTAWGIK